MSLESWCCRQEYLILFTSLPALLRCCVDSPVDLPLLPASGTVSPQHGRLPSSVVPALHILRGRKDVGCCFPPLSLWPCLQPSSSKWDEQYPQNFYHQGGPATLDIYYKPSCFDLIFNLSSTPNVLFT